MSSGAERIVQEIVGLLTVPPLATVPAVRVYRDLMDAIRASAMPAVAVEAGNEESPTRALIGIKDRRVEINITVLAKGTNPYGQADDTVVEVYDRLFNDAHLNGLALDIIEGPTRRQREGLAEDLAAVTKIYLVEYRTPEQSIEID